MAIGRSLVIPLALWLLAAVAIFALIGSFNLPPLFAIVRAPVAMQAVVADTLPTQHQAVRHVYRVDGREYRGSGTVGVGNPDFASLHPGDAVLVFRAASRPELSVLGDPHSRVRNEFLSALLPAVMFPTFAWGVLLFRRRRTWKAFA
ncbi:MAG: hypothetical protein ACTHOH_06230 [Lysobacteraceae bacterium]